MLPVPHLSPTFFYSSPIYLQSNLTLVSLIHFSLTAYMPATFEWIIAYNGPVRTYEVILAFEERYKDIRFQVCKVFPRTISDWGQLRKSPRKSSQWDLFPKPDFHGHRISATANNFSFAKKMARERPKCSIKRLIAIIWTRPEPSPDPNIIQNGARGCDVFLTVAYRKLSHPSAPPCMCYQARPSGRVGQRPEGQARARADRPRCYSINGIRQNSCCSTGRLSW
jgi:hypothetical protein